MPSEAGRKAEAGKTAVNELLPHEPMRQRVLSFPLQYNRGRSDTKEQWTLYSRVRTCFLSGHLRHTQPQREANELLSC
jgi:hypothetical protein